MLNIASLERFMRIKIAVWSILDAILIQYVSFMGLLYVHIAINYLK